MPRALWLSWGEGRFLMSEVPLPHSLLALKRRGFSLQGYLAHKNPPPPRTLPLAYA